MEFIQTIDWLQLLRCFTVGGVICVVGQILIDKTKLTPARILVLFVTLGAVLGGLGIYKYLIDFAGCGATVPLFGFGANLAKGAIESSKEMGLLRSICRWCKKFSWWNSSSSILWLHCFSSCKT